MRQKCHRLKVAFAAVRSEAPCDGVERANQEVCLGRKLSELWRVKVLAALALAALAAAEEAVEAAASLWRRFARALFETGDICITLLMMDGCSRASISLLNWRQAPTKTSRWDAFPNRTVKVAKILQAKTFELNLNFSGKVFCSVKCLHEWMNEWMNV